MPQQGIIPTCSLQRFFHKGQSLLELPLSERRRILREAVKPNEHVQIVEVSTNADIMCFVKAHQLEGVIAKRADSHYLPSKRTNSWVKTRLTQSQEPVIGGGTPPTRRFPQRRGSDCLRPEMAGLLLPPSSLPRRENMRAFSTVYFFPGGVFATISSSVVALAVDALEQRLLDANRTIGSTQKTHSHLRPPHHPPP